MKLLEIGGRIKSASVGLGHLYGNCNVVELDKKLKDLRKRPITPLLEAFFPGDSVGLRQMMRGVGFYRPVLKSDQGMAGNFLPFYINPEYSETDLSVRNICNQEGLAIPEAYCSVDQEMIKLVQEQFNKFNLKDVNNMLKQIGQRRKADKGRTPFFLIRPALTDKHIVFGQDIIKRVNEEVNYLLQKIRNKANKEEEDCAGFYQSDNLLYCQADVFILLDGTVTVEQISCPDVGLFLTEIQEPFSRVLPLIQGIVSPLKDAVCKTLVDNVNSKQIAIVTRDEVLKNREDILELMEIETLKKGLAHYGVTADIYSVSEVDRIPFGQKVILLNIDYKDEKSEIILERHKNKQLVFYPNPFFQMICQSTTGLKEVVVPPNYRKKFLEVIGSRPKNDEAVLNVWDRLESLFCKHGINSDIINADIGFEIVPIFRRSLHSWRTLSARVARYNGSTKIKLRLIPANPENLLLNSDTGARLHVFRFMFIK